MRSGRWIRRSTRSASGSTRWACAEPVIEKYGLGDNEILVQLPGVSDPGRVENIIQSTAKLEIHAVAGTYGSEAEAQQANPGGIPADSV